MRPVLIAAFKQWGMPLSIRVDNGMPLADPQRKSIPELPLWLLSKEIEVIFNRPKQPTDNAKVERMQRTTKDWACIRQAKDINDLELRLKPILIIQREKFKVSRLQYQTRMAVYPELKSNPRPYNAEQFSPHKAYERLANWTLVRKVSKNGQLSLYGQTFYIAKEFRGTYVNIKFDPKLIVWRIFDKNNTLISEFEAKSLKPENIKNLSVGQRT